jgi:hypothetical protein
MRAISEGRRRACVPRFGYLISAESLAAVLDHGTAVAVQRSARRFLFMLCLTRPALGLALVGVCLMGTRTLASDLVSAVLALLQ